MKKRILSFALAFVLVLTLLPIHALAATVGAVYVTLKSGLPGVDDINLFCIDYLVNSEEDFVNGTFFQRGSGENKYYSYKVSNVPKSFGRTDFLCWKMTSREDENTTFVNPGQEIDFASQGADVTLEAIWDEYEHNSYTFSSPQSVTVTENTTTTYIPFTLSELTLGSADQIHVVLQSGEFSDGMNTIHYESGQIALLEAIDDTYNCSIMISQDEWANAKAGQYTADLQYEVIFTANSNETIRTMYGSVPMTLQVGHNITVTSNNSAYGTASASAAMAREGEPVTLTAAPKDKYGLRSWSVQSGGVTVNADNTFIMGNEDVSITAMFDTVYQVTFYNYGDRILYTTRVFYEETPVYSFATPTKPSTDRYDYIFTGWNPPLGPITGDTSYTAQYREEYKCFVDFDANGGTGTMARNSYYKSEGTYTLPSCGFTAPDGYGFKDWTVTWDNGDGSFSTAVYMAGSTLTGLTSDLTVSPNWIELSVNVSPAGAGTAVYENGTFTATANEGYTFDHWEYANDVYSTAPIGTVWPTDNPYIPDSVDYKIYTAVFTPKTYNLKVRANNKAWGKVSFTGTPKTGNTITLTAKANIGYVFKEWLTEPEGIAITNNKFKMPAADVTVTAVFAVAPGWTAYIDADGSTKSANAVPLTGAETELPGDWYVVQGEITCDHAITFTGHAHLILADGASLTITVSELNALYAKDEASLTIYGQSGQSGKLIARSAAGNAIAIGGNLTINGGDIEATAGDRYSSAIASWSNSVTINAGKVTAHGGKGRGIDSDGDVAIYGGVVNADGNTGISSSSGNIILGWTDPGDSITVSSWDVDTDDGKTITVRDGQTLMDAASGALYNGDVTSKIEELACRTLVPYLGPDFKVQSLVLSGQLGVNFFMDLSMLTQDELDASYMDFTLCGKTTKAHVNDAFRDAGDKGYYGFTCYVSSIQMADTITAVFHYGEGKTVRKTYSVKEYLETLESIPDLDEKVTNLVHAIADYGYYAQPYLAAVNGWTVGADHTGMDKHFADSFDYDAIKAAVAGYAIQRDFGSNYVESVKFSLNMSAETKLNVYITPKNSEDTVTATATYNGVTYTAAKQSNGQYKITIPNLSAHQLGDEITIAVTVGSYTFPVKVSALSFVKAALDLIGTEEYDEAEAKAVSAFYKYYEAAMAYKG